MVRKECKKMTNLFSKHPRAINPEKVGKYPLEVYSGGGLFYDDVLEYRVWQKTTEGLECISFVDYPAAAAYYKAHKTLGAQEPIALVFQNSYLEETSDGYKWVKEHRVAEWQVSWLKAHDNTAERIPSFLAKHQR